MTFWSELLGCDYKLSSTIANGLRTRFFESGEGEHAVLFLHGVNGHLDTFVRNLASHAAHYRVLAMDMIGHGFSEKPDYDYEIHHYVDHVLGFLDVMEVKRVSLVGTSLGGWVSARIAARAPERVASLALVSSGGLTSYSDVRRKLSALGSQATGGIEAVRARLEFVIKDKNSICEDLLQSRWEIYRQEDYRNAIKHIMCLQEADIRQRNLLSVEELGRVRAPSIVVWTKDDPTASLEDGQKYADALPNSKLVVFENSSHMPQYEEPTRFNKMHLEFLARAGLLRVNK
jgi:2-hydroxy-6-oxonona-2,4-dienedioate hydrolase